MRLQKPCLFSCFIEIISACNFTWLKWQLRMFQLSTTQPSFAQIQSAASCPQASLCCFNHQVFSYKTKTLALVLDYELLRATIHKSTCTRVILKAVNTMHATALETFSTIYWHQNDQHTFLRN